MWLLQEDIGFLRLSLSDLKAALIPKPAWLQSEIAQRLPKLACDLYNMFIGDVHLATNTLRSHATCAEEYVEQLKFLDALEVRLEALAWSNVSMEFQPGHRGLHPSRCTFWYSQGWEVAHVQPEH